MNNVTLRAGVVTGLYGSSGATSQQTGILGEDTARRMRVRGIPLARHPEEDAGLQVDATDAISADRQARLLIVDRRDAADVRRNVSCTRSMPVAWVYAWAGRLSVPSCPSPAPGIPGGWKSTWPRSACTSMPAPSPGSTLSPAW